MKHCRSIQTLAFVFTLFGLAAVAAEPPPTFPQPTPAAAEYAALSDQALASEKCADSTKPVEVFAPQPEYGTNLRRQLIQGRVILEGIIRSDGSIAYPRVLRAAHPALAAVSLPVFTTYRYKPGTCAGKAVPWFITITHTYRLK